MSRRLLTDINILHWRNQYSNPMPQGEPLHDQTDSNQHRVGKKVHIETDEMTIQEIPKERYHQLPYHNKYQTRSSRCRRRVSRLTLRAQSTIDIRSLCFRRRSCSLRHSRAIFASRIQTHASTFLNRWQQQKKHPGNCKS